MNLERLEELCLNYLAQSPQPLAPLDHLLAHCQRDEACRNVTRRDLLEFLRRHQDITVVEAEPSESDEEEAELLSALGIAPGPKAVLNTRMPSRSEMQVAVVQQLDQMQLALNAALSQAQEARDTQRTAEIQEALRRANSLKEKIVKLLRK